MTTTVITIATGIVYWSQLDAQGCWIGIASIMVDGTELLAPGQRWRPEIRTPEGIELCRFVPVGIERQGEATVLRLRAHARPSRLTEWQIHAPRARLNLNDIDAEPSPLPGTITACCWSVRWPLSSAPPRGWGAGWRGRQLRNINSVRPCCTPGIHVRAVGPMRSTLTVGPAPRPVSTPPPSA